LRKLKWSLSKIWEKGATDSEFEIVTPCEKGPDR